MATEYQFRSLLCASLEKDVDRIISIALQAASHAESKGSKRGGNFAKEIRGIVEKHRQNSGAVLLPKEMTGILMVGRNQESIDHLIARQSVCESLGRVADEFHNREILKQHGLLNRRRILLAGPPGTGKTMSAAVLAKDLDLPLYLAPADQILRSHLGETGAVLRKIFDCMQKQQGVYFFDEFDSIAIDRRKGDEVGEMRRIVNSLLQFIEQDQSDSIIIAATNNSSMLDAAFARRFDDVISYELPSSGQTMQLIEQTMTKFLQKECEHRALEGDALLDSCEGLSHSEIVSACRDAMKRAVLGGREKVTESEMIAIFESRRQSSAVLGASGL